MGASHLDYGDGSGPGGLLDGVVQAVIFLFILFLILRKNKKAQLWAMVYLGFIIVLFIAGERTMAGVIMVLTIPVWLLLSYLRDTAIETKKDEIANTTDEIGKSHNKEHREKIQEVEFTQKRASNSTQATSESPISVGTTNSEVKAHSEDIKPQTLPKPKKAYSGGMIYMIRGAPHQFNGIDFEEIDTSQTVMIGGRLLCWDGEKFVPKEVG